MPIRRGNTFTSRIRVPARYAAVEKRKEVWIALGTDSPSEARALEPVVRARQLREWESLLGPTSDEPPPARYSRMVELAALRGFVYRPADKVAQDPIEEILARVAAIDPARPDSATALLGGVERPRLLLSGMVEKVERLSAHDNRYKSAEQMRLWRSPRLRAVENLRAALREKRNLDDPAALDIDSDMARIHRRWWQARIESEGHSTETANKDYANLSEMLKRVYADLDLDFPKPYGGITNRDKFEQENRKPQFSDDWIRAHIVAPGALDGLNDEAAAILLIALETGCRQSEIHNLPAEDIILYASIPHIRIRHFESDDPNERREVKNQHSVRLMPLVGLALEAARRHPNGFPRYRGKSTFSATVNKFLRERGPRGEDGKNTSIFPTARHTIGGLRHSWESRLGALGLLNDVRALFMGHSVGMVRGRPVYGDDLELQVKHLAAQLVGFDVITDRAVRAQLARELDDSLNKLKLMRDG